jgi:hypothetical protein
MACIPCLLHIKNRISEKIIHSLLIEAMNERSRNRKAQKACIQDFQQIVNESILGTEVNSSQWRVPVEKKKSSDGGLAVGEVNLPNTRARKMVDSLDPLIEISVLGEDRPAQWKKSVNDFRNCMHLLRQREDFTNEEVKEFQCVANEFFFSWIKLRGREGLTNYIHMLGAGHFSYYLYKWRNLYRYEQQGWESLNSKIKTYYFYNTQRGGHAK